MSAVSVPANTAEPQYIPVASIRTDGETQMRVSLSSVAIDEYTNMVRQAWETAQSSVKEQDENPYAYFEPPLPAIDVFYDGAHYWVGDGHHRLSSYKRADMSVIPSVVHEGSYRDAQEYAMRSNRLHGVRMTAEDNRNIIRTILTDPERKTWTDMEIQRRTGIDRNFAAKVRSDLAKELQARGEEPPQRIVKRGGQEYPMDTTGMAKRAPREEEPVEPEVDEALDDAALVANLPLVIAMSRYPHRANTLRQQAMHYLAARRSVNTLRQALNAIVPVNARGAYTDAIRSFLSIPAPDQWGGCNTCFGSLRTPEGEACQQCSGGFVFHQGVSAEEINDRIGDG